MAVLAAARQAATVTWSRKLGGAPPPRARRMSRWVAIC
jgi:hypothetical protein